MTPVPIPSGPRAPAPAASGADDVYEDATVGILLVDDQPARLAALEAALTGLGPDVAVVHATSGKEALRRLLRRDFAVVLLDVHMPIMDGFETAALIRRRARSEQTPIIFITALNPNEAQVTRGYELGAVDYVFAPVHPEVLRTKVSVFLDLHRKSAQVQRQADWLRREAERRAEGLETRLRALLDRLSVGVFRAARDGTLLEANRALLELLGTDPPAAVPPAIVQRLLPGRPADPSVARDIRLVLPGGIVRWVSVTTAPVPGSDGGDRLDGIVEDITARKRAEQDLRAAHATLELQAERLGRSNADLKRFAHAISHDLQEPLRMVSTFVDLLGRTSGRRLRKEAREYLEHARDGAERMQGMIRGLLDFCLLDNTASRLRPVNCNRVVDDAVERLALAIRDAGASVTRDDLPEIDGDDVLLGSVFQNLLGNAIKFRREGVPPRVHVAAEGRDGGCVLSVRDNGIGIDPAASDGLFQIFHRLPGSESIPGSGIGLAICKRIVERHGGRIWTEPTPGGGATFRVALPLQASRERTGTRTGRNGSEGET